MKLFDLKDKVVLITGASSGIGKACAAAFASQGSKLILTGRHQEQLVSLSSKIKEDHKNHSIEIETLPMDLSLTDSIRKNVEQAIIKIGPVDVLINCAAYAVGGLVEDCPVEEYKKNFDVNFFAVLALIQSVLPGMKSKKSGQIINITSGVGKRSLPGFSSYSTTKFALNGLTESLRLEVKPYGIDVISISPGRVTSSFHDRTEFYGRWKMHLAPTKIRAAEKIAQIIIRASKARKREVTVRGPGLIGYHLNYWAPWLLDRILAKKFPVK